jgi:hypothetical protein
MRLIEKFRRIAAANLGVRELNDETSSCAWLHRVGADVNALVKPFAMRAD